jgi:peptidoglycan/xylan/chitin deacetylase (PgdA/CDA1 family)
MELKRGYPLSGRLDEHRRRTSAEMKRSDHADGTLVLCYHALSESWPASLSTTPELFRQQLELLLERGYRGATFHEAVASRPPGRTLVVTFDDAYLSVLELAYPVLSTLGLPATVFVVTEFADSGSPLRWPGIDHWHRSPHHPELRGLNWRQLADLADAGWEIGSHTCTHPRLTRLAPEALARELHDSREACERALGRPCRSLAYPFGDFNRRVTEAAAEAGYEAAAIDDPGQPRDALAWPRIGIYHSDSMTRFRLKMSPTMRRLRIALGRRGAVGA